MSPRTASRTAWSAVAVTVALFVAGIALDAQQGAPGGQSVAPFAPVFLAFAIVGALIVSRRPNHLVGWLSLLQGLAGGIALSIRGYADYGLFTHPLPGALWMAWLSVVFVDLGSFALPLLLLVFPDGHLPSRRWRPVIWLMVVEATFGMAATALADVNFHTNYPTFVDPARIAPLWLMRPIYGAYQFAELAVFALAAISLFIRYRGAEGEERAQLKWVAHATVVSIGGFVAMGLFASEPVIAFIVLVPLIPISIGFAILKYRLYDIDLVIRKTVVFGALAAFITVVYVAIVVALGGSTNISESPAASIIATAVVAALFQPVRARAERLASRLVYGARATPYEVMAGFSSRASGSVSTERVLTEMAEAAGIGVGAAEASVGVGLPGGGIRRETWTRGGAATLGEVRAIPVAYRGAEIGELRVVKAVSEPLTPGESRLLEDLASQAGLALHNVRLTEELAVRLRELAEQSAALRVSRERLVTARDAQRRGLQRDIHEGPERQLLDIAQQVADAAERAASDPAGTSAVLDRLGEQANATLAGLRDLARGIFPPLLAEKGVVSALQAHVRKIGANATVKPSPAFAGSRFDPDTEACSYFCCLQAVQNVIRHAGNATCTISLDVLGGEIAIEVHDDGPGFAVGDTPRGMGLEIMQDRVDALEGRLAVHSAPAGGTTVELHLPARAVEMSTP